MPPSVPSVPPLFIVLEGIDGSGTTTQLDKVVHYLRGCGRAAVATREPSVGPVGKLLREILLGQHTGSAGAPVDGRAMALLFAADRRDHLAREIEPALAGGSDVVSDRYLLSSLAYQAVEADRAWVENLSRAIRVPDLTLFLETPVSVAADRRRQAGRSSERYDADEILSRVSENYLRLIEDVYRFGPVVRIDGSGSIDDVQRSIQREIDRLIVRLTAARDADVR
jgi:dTMP kinase